MTQKEFLQRLQEALENELSGYLIQDNISYYEAYIGDEVKKGRREEAVVAELGDPWAIAKTIIDSAESRQGTQEEYSYSTHRQRNVQQDHGSAEKKPMIGAVQWWKKILLVLGIIGVIMVVVAIISGIFSLIAPLLVPMIIIVIVFRLLGRNR